MSKPWLKFALPLVILALGGLGTVTLIKAKKGADKRAGKIDNVKQVRVVEAQAKRHVVRIRAQGSTEPLHKLTLSAEVRGRIAWLSPQLREGALVQAGEPLIKLDQADYQIQLEQAKANLNKAEFELAKVVSQQEAALKGIKMMGNKQKLTPMALYEPQVKNAKAGVMVAASQVNQAQLNLERTQVKAPFTGFLLSVPVAPGQVVAAGQELAKLFPQSPLLIKASVPLSDLGWVLTEEERPGDGSKALITKKLGNQIHHWQGKVMRRLKEMENLGRLAILVIQVEQTKSDKGFQLPLGMLLNLDLEGSPIERAFSLPQEALRGQDRLWILNQDERLEIRQIEVLLQTDQEILIGQGLEEGQRVITSPLSPAVVGMKLKVFAQAGPRNQINQESEGAPEKGLSRLEQPPAQGKPQTLPPASPAAAQRPSP